MSHSTAKKLLSRRPKITSLFATEHQKRPNFLHRPHHLGRTIAGCVSLALCSACLWTQPAQAEGSRDMFPNGATGNRANLVWRNATSAGFQDRTLLRVYANAGEYILMGSSAIGVSNNGGTGEIEVFNPGTVSGTAANENLPAAANFTCSTDRPGTGFISSRTQELAGPESIDGTGNNAGYTPCWFQAPSTGIYFIAMYGPNGSNSSQSPNSGGGATGSIGTVNTNANQQTGISAWDVTVRESQASTTDLIGRLHTFFLAGTLGNNSREIHSNLFPVTSDGYRYELDLRGLNPFQFRLFGNQLGNLDSDGITPLYHDVLGTNGDIANPVGGTSSAPPQFPIFFNPLDSAVLSSLPLYDPLTGIQTGTGVLSSPIPPNITDAGFTGTITGNTSQVNTGGTFTFSSNVTGTYDIVVSQDGVDFDPSKRDNRVLRGVLSTAGGQSISWDGLDNAGQPFPVGTFDYSVLVRGGEYHFPISDAENNVSGGPTFTLLNATNSLGNTVAFYDHRGYVTVDGTVVADRDPGDGDPLDDALCGTNPPNPPNTNLITGADSSSASFNAFGQTSGGNTNSQCTGAFGDTKTIDIWTYSPSSTSFKELEIIDRLDFGDAPVSYDDTDGSGSIDASDTPAEHEIDNDIFLGNTAPDIDAAPQSSAAADGDDKNDTDGDDTTDTDDEDAISSFPNFALSSTTYTLSNIPVTNSKTATATLHGWIDFDGNGSFDSDEYTSDTIDSGETLGSLSWSSFPGIVAGTTYARFRLTTDPLNDVATTAIDERATGSAADGEVEDYEIVIGSPDLLLVKRITAINNLATNPNDGTDLSIFINDDTTSSPSTDDDNTGWPSNFLIGAIDAGLAAPEDIVEYTIYFLSSGAMTANEVILCDRIPDQQTFITDAFNSETQGPGGNSSEDLGMMILLDDPSTTGNETGLAYTNISDGDIARYYSASETLPTACGTEPNERGAIVVDLGNLPHSTAQASPSNSYGYIRFQANTD